MITIQFSSTTQVASRAISWATWSWASHVDFVLPDGRLLGAIANGGVCIHEPHKQCDIRRVERYAVYAPDSVLDFAFSQIGKPYDWQGVFNFLARNRNWQDEDAWFCSELVAYSFEQANEPLIRAMPYRVTPGNILMSTKLIPIASW